MSDLKLCYGCMQPIGDAKKCPHCGYDQDTATLANYLKPGTMLHDRFLVGKVTDSNGEGVSYIGYDTAVGCKVQIREYMPEQLCSRVSNSTEIHVSYAHLAQYKALMAEYTELNKALARLRNLSHLNPALDLFSENNTTYAVYEYLEGQTLLDYLKENAGELNWNIVRRIFPPLFTTLSLLHNAGVLHRGLSPETIYVTDRGELKLRGFCISAVRTNDTELEAELFDGYAAPEQYFANRQQGTWTDVYGICAVLYRILTGCRAADAMSRLDYDDLTPPAEVNPQIPEMVSKGIMQGMALDGSARVRTITDLVTLLFDESTEEKAVQQEEKQTGKPKADATAVFTAQSGTQPRTGTPPARTGTRRPASAQGRPGTRSNPANRNGARPANRSASGAPQRSRTASGTSGGNGNRAGTPQRRRPNGGYAANPERRRPSANTSRSASRKAQEVSVFEKIRAPLLIAFLFIAIVTVVILAFYKILGVEQQTLNGNESSIVQDENVVPAQTEESVAEAMPDAVVPRLIGKNFTLKRDEMAGWLELEPEYVFDDHIIKDQIIDQEWPEGTEFVSGSTMKVTVSLGPSLVTIPSFKGMRLQSYLNLLKEMGFAEAVDGDGGTVDGLVQTTAPSQGSAATQGDGKHVVKYCQKIDYNYSNGYVCAVTPKAGTVVDALEDYEIIVYYAYNPVYTTIGNGTTTSGSGSTSTTTTTAKTSATTAKTTEELTTPSVTTPTATEPPPVTTQSSAPDPIDPPVVVPPPEGEENE